MYLQYGNVALFVIDLNRYERTNIWSDDGADLLAVRHEIGVSAVYAPGGVPQMTSATVLSPATEATLQQTDDTAASIALNMRGFKPTGINNPPSLETDAFSSSPYPLTKQFSGVETDAELRYRLLSPRQSLILWGFDRQTSAPVAWLQSPRPGFSVDCKNGPRPISCDVIAAEGDQGIGVFFQVETHTQPCPQGSDRLVLSHRWTMSHTHDERNFLTRVIKGTIIFNSEYIYQLGIPPDWVRNQFIHPIPLGYERKVPVIEASSDGLTINYVITDTDPTIVFEPADSGATAIDISENMTYSIPWQTKLVDSYIQNFKRLPQWAQWFINPGLATDVDILETIKRQFE